MITLRGIHKSFQRPGASTLHVLRDVDLQVEAGEFVAVVGPSGSGKTTLMNILGLLDRPDSGEYRLNDHAVLQADAQERARLRNRTIGFVFQQFHLLSRTTALENVELPLIYNDTNDTQTAAMEALCRVGLEDRLSHYPNELSGGQQQRVAIARALVNQPQLILADEPTGNLDQAAGDDILELLMGLNQAGTTIVLITHDQELARRVTRVVRIHEGLLQESEGSLA